MATTVFLISSTGGSLPIQKKQQKIHDWLSVCGLVSFSYTSNPVQSEINVLYLEFITLNLYLQIKKMVVETIDGSVESNRDVRNQLWEIAGTRGYPLICEY